MKCPTCGRQADGQAAECARCGTDFALLADLNRHHDLLLRQGCEALRRRDPESARGALSRALRLRAHSPAALKGLALAALLDRDFPAALRRYADIQLQQHPDPLPARNE